MGKLIKKAIKYDKNQYFNEHINYKMDPSTSWKRVNELLGIQKNNGPTEIKIQRNGQIESITVGF